jgi:hemerythrin
MQFEWKKQYAVGVPAIDEQHQEIFRRIEKLHQALWDGQSPDELIRTLAFLDDYTQAHFRAEEALMEAHAYALLPQHRAEHADLIRQLAGWKAEAARGGLRLTMEVATTLATWLRAHIAMSDRALAHLVRGNDRAA